MPTKIYHSTTADQPATPVALVKGSAIATPSIATVTTTSSTVLAANPERSEILIQNVGLNDCWVWFGAAAVVGSAFLIGAGGDTWRGTAPTGNVTAITASGTTTLTILEVAS